MLKFSFSKIEFPSFIFKETPIVLIGTLSLRLSKFFIFLFAASKLGPNLWGSWNILLLFSMYFSHFHFGLINAFNREGPIYLDDKITFENIHTNVLSGIFISLFIFTVMLFFIVSNYSVDTETIRLFVFYFLFNQLYYFTEIYYKVKIQFKKIAFYQIFRSIFLIISSFFLVDTFLINGLIIALMIPDIFFVLINIKIFKKIKFNLDTLLLKKYVRIGFPIMIVGFSFMLIQTIDRLIILRFFNQQDLGIYSLGGTVFQALLIFPQILSMQFYPRMIRSYGKDKNKIALRNSFFNQLFISLLIVAPIILFAIFTIPLIILNFLPDYIDSINIAQVLTAAVIFLPITFVAGNVLNILDLQKKYLTFQIFAIFVNLFLSILLISFNFGIQGVALATFISFFSYSIIIILYLLNYVFKL